MKLIKVAGKMEDSFTNSEWELDVLDVALADGLRRKVKRAFRRLDRSKMIFDLVVADIHRVGGFESIWRGNFLTLMKQFEESLEHVRKLFRARDRRLRFVLNTYILL